MAIRALAEKYGLDLAALARELIMDWDELRTIAAEPLATIGAHTMTHPALARLPPQAAFREMVESADRIAAEIGTRPTTIAFPYGYPTAATEREAQLAEQAGFAASFTTRPGYVPVAGSAAGAPARLAQRPLSGRQNLRGAAQPGLLAAQKQNPRASLRRCPVGLLHPVDEAPRRGSPRRARRP